MSSPRELRRRVGPLAWAVLQDLAEDAEMVDDWLVARSSARRLAANLGIGKDTAARALRTLTAAGLIVAVRAERGERGRFAAGSYEVTAAVKTQPTETRLPVQAARPRGVVAEPGEQPSLFDDPAR